MLHNIWFRKQKTTRETSEEKKSTSQGHQASYKITAVNVLIIKGFPSFASILFLTHFQQHNR